MKAPHRLVLGVLSTAILAVSLTISAGAPVARGLGPVPSTGLPIPDPSLPLPSLPLPTPSRPLPTASVPVPTASLPLPTISLPLPTVSLPLPSVSPPVPTLTPPPGSGSPGPSDGGPTGGSARPLSSADDGQSDGGAGAGSQGSGPDAAGDATRGGLQVPEVATVPPSLPNVGAWLVPSLGVAVPAFLVAVLVLVQVLSGAAGIRATRGTLDRIGTHVPPWLRRVDAPGEKSRPG